MNRILTLSTRLIAVLSLFVFTSAAPAVTEEAYEMVVGIVALNVPDLDAAEAYYTDVLGFELVGSYPADRKIAFEIFMSPKISGAETGAIVGFAHSDAPSPLPEGKSSYGRIIINTLNAREIAARAVKAGATIRETKLSGANAPVILFFHDLNGYEVELFQSGK